MSNIFQLPLSLPNDELFESLVQENQLSIKRIISSGQTTDWYDQAVTEWVILLQGEAQLTYSDDSVINLKSGDYILIPPHQKHRVSYTSSDPVCIWLAVYFDSPNSISNLTQIHP